jgi:ABC-type transporter Mla maintaining outer membrane lipid asymmetry ATPase subunit MlaF
VIAHSLPAEPLGDGDAAVPEAIVLECGADRRPLRIAPASAQTYCITARDEAACARLVRDALRCPAAELLPRTGGLLSNLSVLENIVLPALYHRRIPVDRVAEQVYEAFEACDLDRGQADALCARTVTDLDVLAARLVALVRSLLMRPAVLLMERVFEGLTADDMARVARFSEYYRRVVAAGTLVYFNLARMPCPEIATDVRAEAE